MTLNLVDTLKVRRSKGVNYRAEKISLYVVWRSLFLLLLITSASTCLQHSRNHVRRNFLSSVRSQVALGVPTSLKGELHS